MTKKAILQTLGTTCHCPRVQAAIAPKHFLLRHHLSLSPAKASHDIASRPTLPLPQGNTYHDPKARYYTGEKQKKTRGCLVSLNEANRSSDWWIIGTKQYFQNVAITEVALNSKTFREQQQPRSAAIRKCNIGWAWPFQIVIHFNGTMHHATKFQAIMWFHWISNGICLWLKWYFTLIILDFSIYHQMAYY